VPAGIQNGKLLRIRDEGVPSGGYKGSLYIKLIVMIPEKLSRRGKELLEELAKTEGQNDSPKPIALSQLADV
jgi:molecular chaperone DnaJ